MVYKVSNYIKKIFSSYVVGRVVGHVFCMFSVRFPYPVCNDIKMIYPVTYFIFLFIVVSVIYTLFLLFPCYVVFVESDIHFLAL